MDEVGDVGPGDAGAGIGVTGVAVAVEGQQAGAGQPPGHRHGPPMGRVGIVGVADHQHRVCGAPIPRPGVSIGRPRRPAGAPHGRPQPPRADGAGALVGEAVQRAEAGRAGVGAVRASDRGIRPERLQRRARGRSGDGWRVQVPAARTAPARTGSGFPGRWSSTPAAGAWRVQASPPGPPGRCPCPTPPRRRSPSRPGDRFAAAAAARRTSPGCLRSPTAARNRSRSLAVSAVETCRSSLWLRRAHRRSKIR